MNSPAQPNVFLVTGNDPASIEAEATAIIAREAGPDPDPFRLDVYREREGADRAELLRQAIRSLLSPPFLGNRKTVWLKDFSGFDCESEKAQPKEPEALALRELTVRISAGVPADIVLVLSGPGADPAKPLANACKAWGQLLVRDRPSRRDRQWRGAMRQRIEERAAEKGVRLAPEVVDYLVESLGTDTAAIQGEIEKLICYVGGPERPIRIEDAEQVCCGRGEELPWALSNALGGREVAESLRAISVLLGQGGDEGQAARSLLGQSARYFRELLQVKVFMFEHGVRSAAALGGEVQRLTAEQRQACLEDGQGAAVANAYRAKALAGAAGNYAGHELIEAVRAIHDAYLKCLTSGTPEREALEEVVIRIASPAAVPSGRR